MSSLRFISVLLLIFASVIHSDTINRDISNDYTDVVCITFPCIINCNAGSSCRNTNISCPITGQGDCIINIIGSSAGYQSTIHTHSSININITISGGSGLRYSTIYAHNQIGAKLRIESSGDHGMRDTKLFAPYGEGSELTMTCGVTGDGNNDQCRTGEYFDDYSTNVVLEAYRGSSVYNTVIKNIFTDNPYFTITKSQSIDPNYRGSVRIYSTKSAFDGFIYYGTDHGNWDIQSINPDTDDIDFADAIIYADHSFITNDEYTISVTSSSAEAMVLTLYAAQNNANIVLKAQANKAFWNGGTGTRYLKVYCSPLLNGQSYILNSFTAISNGENAFYKSTLNINTTVRNVIFISTYYLGFRGTGQYTFGNVLQDVQLISNSSALTYCAKAFYEINLNIVSIGRHLLISDTTELGECFYNSVLTVQGDIGGDVMMQDHSVNGGYLCHSSQFSFGNIGGTVDLSQTGAKGYAFNTVIFNMGSISGDLLITDQAGTGRAIYNAFMTTGDIGGDVIIRDESGAAGGLTCYSTEFTFGHVAGKIDMIITGTIGRSFETAKFTMNSIGAGLLINDTSNGGKGFYNGYMTVNGDIGADVVIYDFSITTGYTASSTEFIFGNITGKLDMMITGIGGHSFQDATFNIASIGSTLHIIDTAQKGHSLKSTVMTVGDVNGDVIIRDESIWAGSTGGRTCYSADFIFNDINGKLDLISIAAGYGYSFELATFNIHSIAGDLTAHDMSEDGRSFLNSYFHIATVTGAVLFRDDAFGTSGGEAVRSADIIIGYVGGDIDLIDASIYGRAFYATNFDFQFIGGSLYADAVRDTVNDEAFRQTDWVIGTLMGNATFKAYTQGAFYGEDAASTLTINNSNNYVFFYSVADNGLRNLHAYFGGHPHVEIIVESGLNAIYSSMFDCRECDTFTLRCNNDADCDGSVDIWCPENNSRDKCKIYCSPAALCNGMDVFTTNGYCEDVRMYCLDSVDNACTFGSSTKIYCAIGAAEYGSTSYSCPMSQDITNNNIWFCGTGVCSNTCTKEPTTNPTMIPSINPTPAPTENPSMSPTPAPTINPTSAPTFSPIVQPTESPITPGEPTRAPTQHTDSPTKYPTDVPSNNPTYDPTSDPTVDPTVDPTDDPTIDPTIDPTNDPTNYPSNKPTYDPTSDPSVQPTTNPSINPTKQGGVDLISTHVPVQSNDENNNNNDESNTAAHTAFIKDNLMMLIVAGLIVAVLIVLCGIFCIYYSRKKSTITIAKSLKMQELDRVKSVSTLASDTDTHTHADGEMIEMTIPQKKKESMHMHVQQQQDHMHENESGNYNAADSEMMNLYGNNNALKMWLTNLGLAQYLQAFKEQGFSDQIASLAEITEQDLKDMGVNKIAHRRTLLKQIEILKNNMPNTNNNNNNNMVTDNNSNAALAMIQPQNHEHIGNGGEELYNVAQTKSFVTENNSSAESDAENNDLYAKTATTQ